MGHDEKHEWYGGKVECAVFRDSLEVHLVLGSTEFFFDLPLTEAQNVARALYETAQRGRSSGLGNVKPDPADAEHFVNQRHKRLGMDILGNLKRK